MAFLARNFVFLLVVLASSCHESIADAGGQAPHADLQEFLAPPVLSLIQRAARQHTHRKDHSKPERPRQHHPGQKTHYADNSTWEGDDDDRQQGGRLDELGGHITREIKKRVVIAVEILETVSSPNMSSVQGAARAAARAAADVVRDDSTGSLSDAARAAADAVDDAGGVSGSNEEDMNAREEETGAGEEAVEDMHEAGEGEGEANEGAQPPSSSDEHLQLVMDSAVRLPAKKKTSGGTSEAVATATKTEANKDEKKGKDEEKKETKEEGKEAQDAKIFKTTASKTQEKPTDQPPHPGAWHGGIFVTRSKAPKRNEGTDTPLAGTILSPTVSVGAALSSTIAVTLTYFAANVGLSSVRTWNQARQYSFCNVERVLESTVSAVYFAPMLCAVFLAVTKRAETISRGHPGKYHLPPQFVQVAVVVSATTFCAHAFFWLLGECAQAAAAEPPPPPAPPPSSSRQRKSQQRTITRLVPPARPAPEDVVSAAATARPPALLDIGSGGDASGGGGSDAGLVPWTGARSSADVRSAHAWSSDSSSPGRGARAILYDAGGADAAGGEVAFDAAVVEVASAGEAEPEPSGEASEAARAVTSGKSVKDAGWVWVYMSHVCMAIMHISLNVVLIGITVMREPEPLYRQKGGVRMSAGTTCTLVLAIPYFAVYLVLHALQSRSSSAAFSCCLHLFISCCRLLFTPSRTPSFAKAGLDGHGSRGQSGSSAESPAPPAYSAPFSLVLTEVAKLAATALNLVPMLCVLFLGTQLLEDWAFADVPNAHPRAYVEVCMYMCTGCVIAQLVLAVVAPFAAGAELHVIGPDGELDFVTRNHMAFRMVGLLRWIVMTFLYIGVEVVCQSLRSSRPLLLITLLLRHLVGCYFLMHAIQWMVITLRELTGCGFTRAIRVLRIAKDISSLCPMLAVLFLECWVRPRHLTTPNGSVGVPQSYAQDAMYLATVSFLVKLLIVLLSGIVSNSPVSTTSHRSAAQRRNCVAFLLLAIFHAATLVLCGSVAVVIGSLFMLTPDNANGANAWLA